MTVEDFAKAAGVTVQTVRLWIKHGKITAEKVKKTPFREVWNISETELKKIGK